MSSGLLSQVGFAAETTYGTRVAPNRFVRAIPPITLKREANRQQGQGIATGMTGDLAAHYAETTTAGSGQLTFDLQDRGLGLIWNTLMGGSAVTPTLISGTSYSASFPLSSSTLGRSLTVQSGVPYRGGTVQCHELTGVKIPNLEVSCGKGEIARVVMDMDAQAWTDSQTLATAAYPAAAAPFNFANMAVRMGTFGSEVAVTNAVQAVQVKIERPHDVEDYTAGAGGLKAQPVINDTTKITGSITSDWLSKATFQDRANSTTPTSLVIEFVGSVAISGANFPTWRLTLPSITFDPDTQEVDGRGSLSKSWSFTWRFDGTNQPTIALVTTDTTL